jgi:hypothetical protein
VAIAVPNLRRPPADLGPLGPYWRRRLGRTLPGEYTLQQLRAVNAARGALGIPSLGGAGGPPIVPPGPRGPLPGIGVRAPLPIPQMPVGTGGLVRPHVRVSPTGLPHPVAPHVRTPQGRGILDAVPGARPRPNTAAELAAMLANIRAARAKRPRWRDNFAMAQGVPLRRPSPIVNFGLRP